MADVKPSNTIGFSRMTSNMKQLLIETDPGPDMLGQGDFILVTILNQMNKYSFSSAAAH